MLGHVHDTNALQHVKISRSGENSTLPADGRRTRASTLAEDGARGVLIINPTTAKLRPVTSAEAKLLEPFHCQENFGALRQHFGALFLESNHQLLTGTTEYAYYIEENEPVRNVYCIALAHNSNYFNALEPSNIRTKIHGITLYVSKISLSADNTITRKLVFTVSDTQTLHSLWGTRTADVTDNTFNTLFQAPASEQQYTDALLADVTQNILLETIQSEQQTIDMLLPRKLAVLIPSTLLVLQHKAQLPCITTDIDDQLAAYQSNALSRQSVLATIEMQAKQELGLIGDITFDPAQHTDEDNSVTASSSSTTVTNNTTDFHAIAHISLETRQTELEPYTQFLINEAEINAEILALRKPIEELFELLKTEISQLSEETSLNTLISENIRSFAEASLASIIHSNLFTPEEIEEERQSLRAYLQNITFDQFTSTLYGEELAIKNSLQVSCTTNEQSKEIIRLNARYYAVEKVADTLASHNPTLFNYYSTYSGIYKEYKKIDFNFLLNTQAGGQNPQQIVYETIKEGMEREKQKMANPVFIGKIDEFVAIAESHNTSSNQRLLTKINLHTDIIRDKLDALVTKLREDTHNDQVVWLYLRPALKAKFIVKHSDLHNNLIQFNISQLESANSNELIALFCSGVDVANALLSIPHIKYKLYSEVTDLAVFFSLYETNTQRPQYETNYIAETEFRFDAWLISPNEEENFDFFKKIHLENSSQHVKKAKIALVTLLNTSPIDFSAIDLLLKLFRNSIIDEEVVEVFLDKISSSEISNLTDWQNLASWISRYSHNVGEIMRVFKSKLADYQASCMPESTDFIQDNASVSNSIINMIRLFSTILLTIDNIQQVIPLIQSDQHPIVRAILTPDNNVEEKFRPFMTQLIEEKPNLLDETRKAHLLSILWTEFQTNPNDGTCQLLATLIHQTTTSELKTEINAFFANTNNLARLTYTQYKFFAEKNPTLRSAIFDYSWTQFQAGDQTTENCELLNTLLSKNPDKIEEVCTYLTAKLDNLTMAQCYPLALADQRINQAIFSHYWNLFKANPTDDDAKKLADLFVSASSEQQTTVRANFKNPEVVTKIIGENDHGRLTDFYKKDINIALSICEHQKHKTVVLGSMPRNIIGYYALQFLNGTDRSETACNFIANNYAMVTDVDKNKIRAICNGPAANELRAEQCLPLAKADINIANIENIFNKFTNPAHITELFAFQPNLVRFTPPTNWERFTDRVKSIIPFVQVNRPYNQISGQYLASSLAQPGISDNSDVFVRIMNDDTTLFTLLTRDNKTLRKKLLMSNGSDLANVYLKFNHSSTAQNNQAPAQSVSIVTDPRGKAAAQLHQEPEFQHKVWSQAAPAQRNAVFHRSVDLLSKTAVTDVATRLKSPGLRIRERLSGFFKTGSIVERINNFFFPPVSIYEQLSGYDLAIGLLNATDINKAAMASCAIIRDNTLLKRLINCVDGRTLVEIYLKFKKASEVSGASPTIQHSILLLRHNSSFKQALIAAYNAATDPKEITLFAEVFSDLFAHNNDMYPKNLVNRNDSTRTPFSKWDHYQSIIENIQQKMFNLDVERNPAKRARIEKDISIEFFRLGELYEKSDNVKKQDIVSTLVNKIFALKSQTFRNGTTLKTPQYSSPDTLAFLLQRLNHVAPQLTTSTITALGSNANAKTATAVVLRYYFINGYQQLFIGRDDILTFLLEDSDIIQTQALITAINPHAFQNSEQIESLRTRLLTAFNQKVNSPENLEYLLKNYNNVQLEPVLDSLELTHINTLINISNANNFEGTDQNKATLFRAQLRKGDISIFNTERQADLDLMLTHSTSDQLCSLLYISAPIKYSLLANSVFTQKASVLTEESNFAKILKHSKLNLINSNHVLTLLDRLETSQHETQGQALFSIKEWLADNGNLNFDDLLVSIDSNLLARLYVACSNSTDPAHRPFATKILNNPNYCERLLCVEDNDISSQLFEVTEFVEKFKQGDSETLRKQLFKLGIKKDPAKDCLYFTQTDIKLTNSHLNLFAILANEGLLDPVEQASIVEQLTANVDYQQLYQARQPQQPVDLAPPPSTKKLCRRPIRKSTSFSTV